MCLYFVRIVPPGMFQDAVRCNNNCNLVSIEMSEIITVMQARTIKEDVAVRNVMMWISRYLS